MSFRSGLRRDRGRVECRAAVLSPTVALRGMNNLTNFSSPEAALSRFILERINKHCEAQCVLTKADGDGVDLHFPDEPFSASQVGQWYL